MFYAHYLVAELRRRPFRTALTALGLAVGVGLVVLVSALSAGVDDAQDEVLEPLTGVGTDMTVSRPLKLPELDGGGGGDDVYAQLPAAERRALERERDPAGLDLSALAKEAGPGGTFSTDRFFSSQVSLPAAEAEAIEELPHAQAAAAGLSLRAVHISGRVPAERGGEEEPELKFSSLSVSGVDVSEPELAPVAPGQITAGRFLSRDPHTARREAVVDVGYARQNGLELGDEIEVAGKPFRIVGLSSAPLGGEASNVYVELGRLQRLADRKGRATVIRTRADSADAVEALAGEVRTQLAGAQVVTASDLADRVSGSLVDAKNLSSKLGSALAAVALLAAFLLATLLTLSGVQKRIRELGTLRALGWRRRLVVRQVVGEALVQGLAGGVAGALLGIGGAAILGAIGPTLKATVGDSGASAFGQGQVVSGSVDVVLGAPVDVGLLVLAVALALAGGLLAGGAGALRAARLRPALALRSAE